MEMERMYLAREDTLVRTKLTECHTMEECGDKDPGE